MLAFTKMREIRGNLKHKDQELSFSHGICNLDLEVKGKCWTWSPRKKSQFKSLSRIPSVELSARMGSPREKLQVARRAGHEFCRPYCFKGGLGLSSCQTKETEKEEEKLEPWGPGSQVRNILKPGGSMCYLLLRSSWQGDFKESWRNDLWMWQEGNC